MEAKINHVGNLVLVINPWEASAIVAWTDTLWKNTYTDFHLRNDEPYEFTELIDLLKSFEGGKHDTGL